ncbi:MAG: HlyD family efflux transporter periplasmic adaptor subunit, partial [Pseudomonadota bacterium]|nr:HlyD family efflux transporter periplasmic adaptor subunit [Pseudomonadota bacterium]
QDRRVISAPFDGFLSEAPYQLGDVIAPGSLIVAMEDSDLVLQVAQVTSQLEEISSEIQTARAQRDTARVQSLEAQARQVRVQLDLAEQQLQQARFTAEATSAVVGGDAWRRVGGRVRLGEALLELAATDRFRLLVFVDEDWIADLSPGDQGTLLLTAYPAMPIAVTLDSITTDPQLRDGRNNFAAWMRLDQLPDVTLLDGMRGVVRVDAGETTMLQAYLRGSLRWLRRSLWRWGL